MRGKTGHLKLVETECFANSVPRRLPNSAYRTREHLTEKEMAVLLDTLKTNRHGDRDWLIGLLIYRHGLRVSEACDLRWDDIDFAKRTIIIRRLKGSHDIDSLSGTRRAGRAEAITARAGAQVRPCVRQSSVGSRLAVWALHASSSALARLRGCRSPYTSTCCATPPVTPWRPKEWIHVACNTTSATRRSRTRCATRPCRRSRSRMSGDEPDRPRRCDPGIGSASAWS